MKRYYLYNLVEAIKEAPLYSVLEIKSGTIMDGCMFLIQEFDVLNTEVLQAIILEKELKLIDKKYFGELFAKKGMMSKEGERNENHPHFQHTPVVLRRRTRLNSENPPPAKRNTGGYPCDKCGKVYKTLTTLSKHKCNIMK